MRRIRIMLLSFIALFLLSAPSIAEETTKEYVIKKGDTLWDISKKEMMDPFLWPRLWKENPEIKNPDRIYPGHSLKIPVKEVVEEKRPGPLEEVVVPPMEEKVTEKAEAPVEVPKEALKAPVTDKFRLASAGYIATAGIDKSEIVDSPDRRVILGQRDFVYLTLSSDMKVGDRFTILRIVKKITHPKTGVLMGNLVKVLGDLKIIGINEHTATGEIVNSYDYITRGDRVDNYTEIEIPQIPVGAVSSTAGINGYIVESLNIKVANAQMDVVYLDKGLKDGLKAGDRFKVVAAGGKGRVPSTRNEIRLPDQVIGEVQILGLQGDSSTATILKSTKDIKRGDIIQSF